jgi:hyperosmotically inducible periplasmic protein
MIIFCKTKGWLIMKLSKLMGLCLVSGLLAGNAIAHNDDNQANPAAAAQAAAQPAANQAVALMNETTEATTTTKKVSDSEITSKVKEKFIQDKLFTKKEMSAMNIRVKTSAGVVHLTGNVHSKDQEDKATEAAKSVEGVKEVKSEMKIKEKK